MKTKRTVFILLTALLFFLVVTILVITENEPVAALNHSLYLLLTGEITQTWTTVSIWVGSLTHWYSYTPILLLLLLIPSTRMKIGVPLGITLGVSALAGPIILKNVFAIERPDHNQLIDAGGFGYPSGHSLNAMVFFGMCAMMVWLHSSRRPLYVGATIFAAFAILAVGLSRIYLGVHTVTEVIGGYSMGIVILCAASLVYDRVREQNPSLFGGD